MAERRIGITIQVAVDKAATAVQKFVRNSLDRLVKKTDEIRTKLKPMIAAYEKLQDVFTPLNQALELFGKAWRVVTAIIGAAVDAVGAWIEASSKQEAMELRLANAIQFRAQSVSAAAGAVTNFNNALQAQLGIGDEHLLQLQGTLVSMGVLPSKLKEATEATIGLSNATGQGFNEAAKVVSKVLQGETTALREYGIIVNNVGEAQSVLSDLFMAAAESSDTLNKKTQAASAFYADLGEKLGDSFTKSDQLKDAVGSLVVALQDLNTTLGVLQPALTATVDAIVWLEVNMVKLLKLVPGVDFVLKGLSASIDAFKSFVSSAADTSDALGSGWKELTKTAIQLETPVEDVAEAIRNQNEAGQTNVKTVREMIQAQLDWKKTLLGPGGRVPNADETAKRKEAIKKFQDWKKADQEEADSRAFEQNEKTNEEWRKQQEQRAAYMTELREQEAASNDEIRKRDAALEIETNEASFQASTELFKRNVQRQERIADTAARNFVNLFEAATKGAEALTDAVKALIVQLVKMAAIALLKTILKFALGASTGGASFGATFATNLVGSKGGVVPGGLERKPLLMDRGGVVPDTGTDRDVFPALLRRGEEVLTPEQRGGGGTTVINVPLQLDALPDRAAVARHYRSVVLPIVDEIRSSNFKTSFNRSVRAV